MNNSNITSVKIKYVAPHIESIKIDSEIALSLESTPPVFPGETYNGTIINDKNPIKV